MVPDLYVSPWWQASLVPPVWDVAGVRVRALSLWHTFALEQIGNAYVCGGVCDRDAAAALLLFAQLDRAGGRALMLRPLYRARAMRSMHKRLARVPVEGLHNACMDYVRTCLRAPDHKEPINDGQRGKAASAPYQWHIVLTLTSRCGMTVDEAWDYPYSEARCLHDVYAETRGDDTLSDDRLQRAIDDWPQTEGRAS